MDGRSRHFAWLLCAVNLLSIAIPNARSSVSDEIDPGFFTLTNTPEIGRHKDLYIYAISSDFNRDVGTIEFNKTGGLPSEIVKTGEFTPSESLFLGCYLKVGQSERYGSYRYGEHSASFIFNDDSQTPLMSPAFVKPETEWLNTDGVYTVTIYPDRPGGTDLSCPENIGVRYTPGCRKIVWCRDKRRNVNMGPRLKLTKTTQAGLYTIFRPTRKNRGWFVQILVIAASCPKNYYHDGTDCVLGPICKNGGVLKDKDNVCTCPPFFSGDDCGCVIPALADCGEGWISWRGFCYMLAGAAGSWADVQASCQGTVPSSNLLIIRCQSEQDFIEGILGVPGGFLEYWMGLYDPGDDDNVLEYVDGTEYIAGTSYNNFAGSEPSGPGNCVSLDSSNGLWINTDCSPGFSKFGLCKRPAGVIPGPDPISFTLVREDDQEIQCRDLPPCTNVKCRGLLVCHNDNYGCKCSSGWWGNACDRPCQKGRFGPNCEEYCPPDENDCNRFVGPSSNTDCGCGYEPVDLNC